MLDAAVPARASDAWFRSLSIRGEVLPSRVTLAPINTGFVEGGVPTTRLRRFHRERAGPAIGVSMVGNVAVDEDSRTNSHTAVLSNAAEVTEFAPVANEIRAQGSVPGIQLANSPALLEPLRLWKAPDRAAEIGRLRDLILAFDSAALHSVMARFAHSSSLAIDAGFRLVQIHAAHGYLLSMLLTPELNARKDCFAWNGEWLDDLLFKVRAAIGDAILSLRISAVRGLADEDSEIEVTREVSIRAYQSGVDIIDLSAGLYTLDRRLIYPGRESVQPVYLHRLSDLVAGLEALVCIAGRITNISKITSPVPDRTILSIGRPLIADSGFCEKWRSGQVASVRECSLKNQCHYFSRGKLSLECGVNPSL